MTEKELLNQIKASAEQVDVPDSITPEYISAKLQNRKNMPRFHRFSPGKLSSAAAVFLLCGILSGVAWNADRTAPGPALSADTSANIDEAEVNSKEKNSLQQDNLAIEKPKQNAGTLYTVAKSYDQIYNVLESSCSYSIETEDVLNDTAEEKSSFYDTAGSIRDLNYATAESAKKSYSTTNLQTEGVDEGDIIKTDGRYIYTITNKKVVITDAADGALSSAGTIQPDLNSADSILELYVDNDALLLLVQRYETTLEESIPDTEGQSYTTDEANSGFIPLEGCNTLNSIQTNASTILYVYDVTDPANPILTGTTVQDGFYQTSRKIGDIFYLFTEKSSLAYATLYTDGKNGIIPCINGIEIPTDHIYLPKEGSEGLILSSVNINKPDEIVDNVMIIHNYVDIYVGNDSIYLYHTDYENEDYLTQIAKFHMENGKIDAVNAASVKGEILDTFAINEYQDTLRVLTTSIDNNGISNNHLFLFDKNLAFTGSLDDIARDEEIYAARYFENTAYFITYRNTDPLFAVDLSDASNPVLLGQLEITGFSEYLHFWGDDKLLGIGYETDPDTGAAKGLKLVMFDISTPTHLQVIDSLILKDCYYSSSLYDYKCVLADYGKNLIGFAAEFTTDNDSYLTNYLLYTWDNDHFTEKLSEELSKDVLSYAIRGIYIGNKFYIAGIREITSYDMEDNFKKLNHLSLNQ